MHDELGEGHQCAHGTEVEIDDDRAVFLPERLNQRYGQPGKHTAHECDGLPEKSPGELKIKQNPDADHDHGNADDFMLSDALSVNQKRENGGKGRKGIENDQGRGYRKQTNRRDNGNKGSRSGTPPDDQQADVISFIQIAVASEDGEEYNYTAEEPVKTNVPDGKLRTKQLDQKIEKRKQ